MGFAPIGIERKEQREDANRRKEGSYAVVTEQEIHDGREHPNAGEEIPVSPRARAAAQDTAEINFLFIYTNSFLKSGRKMPSLLPRAYS